MKEYKVEGHISSYLPENKNWKLVWNDEFDGTQLDKTKWDFRTHMMGKRHRTWIEDEGIELDGKSNVIFKCIEKDGEICSCQLQTGYNYMDAPHKDDGDCWGGGLVWPIGKFKKHKFLHGHGYYECRCKLQKKEGWWSAFWVQSPTIGCCDDTEIAGVEIDIMESFKPGKIAKHNVIYNGYGDDYAEVRVGLGEDAPVLDTSEWHTFGLLWDETGYTYYIDGKEDGHADGPMTHREEFIIISTEVKGYRSKERRASDAARLAVGDEFIVDYVRVFDEIK